jgi:hypothetical protein
VAYGEECGLLRQIEIRMNLRQIFDSIKSDRGGSVKYSHYLEIYDKYFSPLRDDKLSLLEIGIERGGSLSLWKEYFDDIDIYALDINPNCKMHEREGIQIFIGDQTDKDFLNSVVDAAGRFDIIVDDGGHRGEQHIASFETLFPHLSNDGLYIVEDLHTAYMSNFGGSYKGPTFIEFAKGLCDLPTYAGPVDTEYHRYLGKIKEIAFYHSLVVIRKGRENDERIFTPDFHKIPWG